MKRVGFHEELVARDAVNSDSPAVGTGLAQGKHLFPDTGRPTRLLHHSRVKVHCNDKNPPGYSFVRYVPGSVYFPGI